MSDKHHITQTGHAQWQRALLDPATPVPGTQERWALRSWNGSDPGQRFAIYRNNVLASLTTALADTFPVLQRLLGMAFFPLASEFVGQHPPTTPILAHYGAEFPAWLSRQPVGLDSPWLQELAELEWHYVCAFHAADAPRASPLGWQALLAEPSALAACRPRPHPSFRLLRCQWAVVTLWARCQGADTATPVTPPAHSPEQACLLRTGDPEEQVIVVHLAPEAAIALSALQAGATLLEALEQASAQASSDWQAASLLANWIELALFSDPLF